MNNTPDTKKEHPKHHTFEKVTLVKADEGSVTLALIDDYQRGKLADFLANGWVMTRRWMATPATRTTVEIERDPKHRAEPDGAPQTREEVTAGYINPSQARMAAWEQKLELTR